MIPFSVLLSVLFACAPDDDDGDSANPAVDTGSACFVEAPTALIGTGETSFEDLADGDSIYMQRGSQGGEHILGSIRLWGTDGIVVVHYTIARQDNGVLVSDQTFRVAMFAEGDCAYMYPGLYGYLGFTSEETRGLQGTDVVLQMDATDSAGRHAYDEVDVHIAMNDPVSE